MHITFDNTPSSNVDKVTTAYKTATSAYGRREGGYALDISGKVTDNTAYGFARSRGVHGRTAEEVMQAAGGSDVTLYRNYMTVMSNSMSDEDFGKLLEEGYHPSDMDLDAEVTIVDTIKAELVKAGVNITGYTDDVDADKLAEITGSEAYAQSLAKSFAAEDIPLTEENIAKAMDAFERGRELTEMSEGATKYMVTNGLEPEIDNLYLAQHAGAVDADRQGRGYFKEEQGYYARKATGEDVTALQGQMEKVIEKAGYEVSEETLADAKWLIEKGVPLTEQTYSSMEQLKKVVLPASEESLFEAIAGALADGKQAGEGNLFDGRSIYRKAADSYIAYEEKYRAILSAESNPENIKARRQLEEIRLHMTIEANVKLLKSGFSIDTAPMEELIDALKQLEEQSVSFPQEGTGVLSGEVAGSNRIENAADICREALNKSREIPHLPAVAVGRLFAEKKKLTIDSVYETGTGMREAFRVAGESYETMMTTPRADMGDSIKKAFRNVDELLTNMGLELNDENRKAVRSLSYNQIELTEENLTAVKEAASKVERVVNKMTPASVLEMIRAGVNPLKTSMDEMEQFFAQMDPYPAESEKYSRFLRNLEHNNEITPEEKESFIGVYRLLRQIEKSDGAVIGRLVSTQAEISFANLLSAIRTGKVRGVDVSVNGEFGSLQEAVLKGTSIDTQIESAFAKDILEEIRTVQNVSDDAIRMLRTIEEPVTIDNLLAADAIRRDGVAPFKKMQKEKEKVGEAIKGISDILKDADFESTEVTETTDVFTDRETFTKAYETLVAESKSAAEEMTFAQEMGSLDVRAMQLVCKQLHIQGVRAAKEQEYDLPQYIDGELTAIHLKLVHDSETKGKLAVSINTEKYGDLAGEFSLEQNKVSGYFAGKGEETLEILQKAADAFAVKLQDADFETGTIQVVDAKTGGRNLTGANETETQQLYNVAGLAISAFKQALTQIGAAYEN